MAVVDLEDHRPHVSIIASDGVHILPVSLLRDVVASKQPSSILTEPVLQRIIEEWLEGLTP